VTVATGKSVRLTAKTGTPYPLRPEACVFSPDGRRIAYVREVEGGEGRFNQVFFVELPV
jgi:hypothetical protein